MTTIDAEAVPESVSGSRRSILRAIGVTLLAGGVATKAAATAGESTISGQSAVTASQDGQREYRGIVQTRVLASDGLETTDQQSEGEVVVVFGPPRGVAGGLQETNPFNLFIGPGDPNRSGESGVWETHSALLSGPVLFQFWEFELAEDGTFTGVLVDPHNQEAIAANLINVDTPLIPGRPQLGVNTLPKAMGEGTQLSGAVTEDGVSIRLVGATIDQFTQFESQLEATRVA